jgi:histidinol-phosphatase (PHP family)
VSEALPNDLHVHTEWSYDAPDGSMEETCRRAVAIGLPAIAFTEHAELAPSKPQLEVEGYLREVERCRALFPSIRIRSGIELGQPHRYPEAADAVLRTVAVDLVLGSVHRIQTAEGSVDLDDAMTGREPRDVVRDYFEEMLGLLGCSGDFAVLAHLDYVKRSWPSDGTPYEETDFEEEYRSVLKAAASNGLALEINTDREDWPEHWPCPRAVVVGWWHDAGGEAVTFGSDAHEPGLIATDFVEAAAIAEAAGFRSVAGSGPHDFGFWLR